jgi:hypothetical protein
MYGFSRQENQSHVTDLEIFSLNPTRSIFVRDLPYFCCSTDLAKFFYEQLHVPIVHTVVCKNKKRRTLQFGCVMFENEEHVTLAVEVMNGKRFVGRDIRVMFYDTNSPLEASTTGLIHISFKTLLPQCPLVTEAVLRDSFEPYGEIEHVSIRSHKYSEAGMQGGYGFLTFCTPEQNQIVVDKVRQTIINGVLYDCSWSESNAQKSDIPEGGVDHRYQDSKVTGGRPLQRGTQRPPVALHEATPYNSAYQRMPDPRLNAGLSPRAYGGSFPSSYDVPYDRGWPADPALEGSRIMPAYASRGGDKPPVYSASSDAQFRPRPHGMLHAGSRFDEGLRPPGHSRFDDIDPYAASRINQQPAFDPRIGLSPEYNDYDSRFSRRPTGYVAPGRGPPIGGYYRSPSEHEDYAQMRATHSSQYHPPVNEYGSLAYGRSYPFAQPNRLDHRPILRRPDYEREYSGGFTRGGFSVDDLQYDNLSSASLRGLAGNASGTNIDSYHSEVNASKTPAGLNQHYPLDEMRYSRVRMSQGLPGDELFTSNARFTGVGSLSSQTNPPSSYLSQGMIQDSHDFVSSASPKRSISSTVPSVSATMHIPLDIPVNSRSSFALQFPHLALSEHPSDSLKKNNQFDSHGAVAVPKPATAGFVSTEDCMDDAWFRGRSGTDTSTANKPQLPLFFTDASGTGNASIVSLEVLGGLEDTVLDDKASLGEKLSLDSVKSLPQTILTQPEFTTSHE